MLVRGVEIAHVSIVGIAAHRRNGDGKCVGYFGGFGRLERVCIAVRPECGIAPIPGCGGEGRSLLIARNNGKAIESTHTSGGSECLPLRGA
ncbi:MAG: hypothetical protein NT107_09510 [Planctomycetota bacterium]|nr:hypothetical protein [Planctomycetota bacterium]